MLKQVPTEASGDEAAKVYAKIMSMIKQMFPDKEEEFAKQCQLFGTCPSEEGTTITRTV
jgi:hypothetical protein